MSKHTSSVLEQNSYTTICTRHTKECIKLETTNRKDSHEPQMFK